MIPVHTAVLLGLASFFVTILFVSLIVCIVYFSFLYIKEVKKLDSISSNNTKSLESGDKTNDLPDSSGNEPERVSEKLSESSTTSGIRKKIPKLKDCDPQTSSEIEEKISNLQSRIDSKNNNLPVLEGFQEVGVRELKEFLLSCDITKIIIDSMDIESSLRRKDSKVICLKNYAEDSQKLIITVFKEYVITNIENICLFLQNRLGADNQGAIDLIKFCCLASKSNFVKVVADCLSEIEGEYERNQRNICVDMSDLYESFIIDCCKRYQERCFCDEGTLQSMNKNCYFMITCFENLYDAILKKNFAIDQITKLESERNRLMELLPEVKEYESQQRDI